MKKLYIAALATIALTPATFADLEGTIQGDIMTTSLIEGEAPVIQGDIMLLSNEVMEIKKFYRDGKTPKVYKSLEELLKNEKNITTVTDGCNNGFVTQNGDVAMTEMYCENIYGKNGVETWSRTDTLLPIYGDNVEYFNEGLFQRLDKNQNITSNTQKYLKNITPTKLEKALEKADKQIDAVKRSRIVKQAQDDRITKLLFVKILLLDEIIKRN